MSRRKKKTIRQDIMNATLILFGAATMMLISSIDHPWHTIIPWSTTLIFFVLWRLNPKRNINSNTEHKTKVKRYS
jgi:hypothetical protein